MVHGDRQLRGWPAMLDPRQPASWAGLLVPGIAVLLADGYDLGRLSLWRDEAYTLNTSQRSVTQVFALLHHTNAVNSAYYLVIHGDIIVFGTSEAALRLPSLLAMAVAAMITAAIGRRLATSMALPAPSITGALAGLLFVAMPEVTRYAHDARPYGIVTMFATIATYLLLRALANGRWRWWAGYGAAIVAVGLFNLLALLLVIAHEVTVVIARGRQRTLRSGGPAPELPVVRAHRWATAVVGALIVMLPLLILGVRQRHQVAWLTRPTWHRIVSTSYDFTGSKSLTPLVALIILAAVTAAAIRPRARVDAVTVGLPWLVLPPGILLAASQVHPIYDFRYVTFCLPALALLEAAALAWLTELTMIALAARGAVAWLPAAIAVAGVAALLVGPQQRVRGPGAWPDNLRAVSAIVAAHERAGDGVVYLPFRKRVFGMGYPGPFQRLRDIALAESPAAAGNLLGHAVNVRTLRRRFASVRRVWLVAGHSGFRYRGSRTEIAKAEIAQLRRLRVIGRWHVRTITLTLFALRPALDCGGPATRPMREPGRLTGKGS